MTNNLKTLLDHSNAGWQHLNDLADPDDVIGDANHLECVGINVAAAIAIVEKMQIVQPTARKIAAKLIDHTRDEENLR